MAEVILSPLSEEDQMSIHHFITQLVNVSAHSEENTNQQPMHMHTLIRSTLTARIGMYRMMKCWVMEKAMAASSHLFLQGGMASKLWFSLRLRGEEMGGGKQQWGGKGRDRERVPFEIRLTIVCLVSKNSNAKLLVKQPIFHSLTNKGQESIMQVKYIVHIS